MKKIYLKESKSKKGKGKNYSGVSDAFDIAAVAEYKNNNEGKISRVQRRKIQKHVNKMVSELKKGKHSPGTMTVCIHGDMNIYKEKLYNASGEYVCTEYYILWPETDEEMAMYSQYIEIIDGQHRCVAFSSLYDLKSVFETYDVSITVLDHPDEKEMLECFIILNGKGKPMSKELIFDYMARVGALNGDVMLARKLLQKANEDSLSPLYGKIKFGESKGTYGALTIINRWINKDGAFNLIEEMNKANLKTFGEKYQFLFKLMKAVDEENKINEAEQKRNDPSYKSKTLSATKYGAVIKMIAPTALNLVKTYGKRRTESNMRDVYHVFLNKVLLVNNIHESGNEAIRYEKEGQPKYVSTDRWNGNKTVDKETAHLMRYCEAAYNNELKAEVVK